MDRDWKINIYNSIKDISDIEKQKRLWLGLDGSLASSFDEDMSMLFDSYCFEDFVKQLESETPKSDLAKRLRLFYNALDSYKGKSNDSEILNDKDWHKLVNEAKNLVSNWKI